MIVKNLRLLSNFNGDYELTLTITNKTDLKALQELTEVDLLDITIKKHRNKKTPSQNSYLWFIANEIAKKVKSTKLEIYRLAIRSVGVFSDRTVNDNDVEFFVKAWRKKGDGWVCDKMIDKPIKDHTTIRFHKGSSEYDTEEMSRLIDYLVTEAKELGIDVMPIEEIERMK